MKNKGYAKFGGGGGGGGGGHRTNKVHYGKRGSGVYTPHVRDSGIREILEWNAEA